MAEVRKPIRETGHHLGCFRTGECANGVDQFATRLYGGQKIHQKLVLNFGQLANVLRSGCPARVRVALPGSDSGTRRVNQHTVERRFEGKPGSAAPGSEPIIENPSASGAALQFFQAPFRFVGGPN